MLEVTYRLAGMDHCKFPEASSFVAIYEDDCVGPASVIFVPFTCSNSLIILFLHSLYMDMGVTLDQ
jgi:hypothetical protein